MKQLEIQRPKFTDNSIRFIDVIIDTRIQRLDSSHQVLHRFVQVLDTLKFRLQRRDYHLEHIEEILLSANIPNEKKKTLKKKRT